ncbi:MAG: MBL fold metallo-hydrolase [Anaerolineae bacterium]
MVLGSGGAFRLPTLGCHCPVCTAARQDARQRRTTSSLWLRKPGLSLLLDASPDLYQQALREGIEQIDAILITHAHRDHMLGIECLETVVRYGQCGKPVRILGPEDLTVEVSRQFAYLERPGWIVVSALLPDVPVDLDGLTITPFAVRHHCVTTFGYRVQEGERALVYLPDVKTLPDGAPLSMAMLPPALVGADLFFVDATFDDESGAGPGHITWQEAAALGARSGARCTVLCHISHRVNLEALRRATSQHLVEGHDGQRFQL